MNTYSKRTLTRTLLRKEEKIKRVNEDCQVKYKLTLKIDTKIKVTEIFKKIIHEDKT